MNTKTKITTAVTTFFLFLLLTSYFLILPFTTLAAAPDELKRAIEEKAKGLNEINRQIQATQKQLSETSQKGKTLNSEIKRIDASTNQLGLGIKAGEITLDKLHLEIHSLEFDINDKEDSIALKRAAIVELLRELQSQAGESSLLTFLRGKSLAESMLELQSLTNVNNNLSEEVHGLEIIRTELSSTLAQKSDKEKQVTSETETLKNKKDILEDQRQERQQLLSQTKNQERAYQKQLADLAAIQDEISKEIEGIESQLRSQIDPNLLPFPRPGVLRWPVRGGVLTQGYGATAFAAKTYSSKYHNGIDIGAPLGTEILAAEKGVVINAGNQDAFCPKGAYGRFVVIKHENGLTTLYGHMARVAVTVGTEVEAGQTIGYMGKTGWATGVHLHFTVFATQTLTPARPGAPEGTRPTRVCGPMPVGGDLDPTKYVADLILHS